MKIRQLQQLQQQVEPFIPQEIQSHCQVANLRDGVLVFALSSSAWSTSFRYLVPQLLSTLRQKAGLPQLSSIEFYIEPDFTKLWPC